jgi:hypothetical protein
MVVLLLPFTFMEAPETGDPSLPDRTMPLNFATVVVSACAKLATGRPKTENKQSHTEKRIRV